MKNKPRRIKVRNIKSNAYFTGRFIGLINDEEFRAVINVDESVKKIETSESLDFSDLTFDCHRKRFVVVTSDYEGCKETQVFISPKIIYMAYTNLKKRVDCVGGEKFEITPLEV
jgi:hypothetical protein